MGLPLSVRIEQAKSDITSVVVVVRKKCELPPCIMEGVLESVLSKAREDSKAELINDLCQRLAEKEKGEDDNSDISA